MTPGKPVARFAHRFRPWWIGVICPWCEFGPASGGCMVCGPLVEKVQALASMERWRDLKATVLAEPDANAILADWLDEQGWPELADEARRTWTHITACPRCQGKGKVNVQRYGRLTVATAIPRPCYYCNQTGKKLVVEVVERVLT